MLLLKVCPKCHGDMTYDFPDIDDKFCLQCGERIYKLAPLEFTKDFDPSKPKKLRTAKAVA